MNAAASSFRRAAVAAVSLLTACAASRPANVASSSSATAAAKPAGCPLEVLYKRPARAFEELRVLHADVKRVPKGGAVEVLRDEACALGADALVVTQEMPVNLWDQMSVTATAIRYTDAAAAPRPEATAPPARTGPPAPEPGLCALAFLRNPPGRAFEELGRVSAEVAEVPPGGAVEALHQRACDLGADAVIVTQQEVLKESGHTLVTGTAIRWKQ